MHKQLLPMEQNSLEKLMSTKIQLSLVEEKFLKETADQQQVVSDQPKKFSWNGFVIINKHQTTLLNNTNNNNKK